MGEMLLQAKEDSHLKRGQAQTGPPRTWGGPWACGLRESVCVLLVPGNEHSPPFLLPALSLALRQRA